MKVKKGHLNKNGEFLGVEMLGLIDVYQINNQTFVFAVNDDHEGEERYGRRV